MSKEYEVGDTKHAEWIKEWTNCFEIPSLEPEFAVGYETELQTLVEALRGVLVGQDSTLPFRSARGVQSGIFLHGVPGCGKTHLVHVAANILDVPLLVATYPMVQGVYFGETSRRMASLFDAGRQVAQQSGGAILFLDELEAFGHRSADPDQRAYSAMVSNLLKFMDSVSTDAAGPRLAIVAATNHTDACDPALLSRFSRQMEILPPGPGQRRAFLQKEIREARTTGCLSGPVDLDRLVDLTNGLTMRGLCQLLDEVNTRWLASPPESRHRTVFQVNDWLLDAAGSRGTGSCNDKNPEGGWSIDPAFG